MSIVARLIRGGEDLISVAELAELAGHARLETLKVYSQRDNQSALRHLTVDQ